MDDRDHFAAAALTALIIAMRDEYMSEICESAYGWADAMLRERDSRIAKTTDHDAAPAARAQTAADTVRTDKAVTGPGAGTGDTPAPHATPGECSEPREGTEPVAWAVVSDSTHEIDCEFVYADEVTAGDIALEFNGGVVPLYRSPPCQGFSQKNLTLAADEREALLAMAAYLDTRGNLQMQAWGSLLRILERRLA